jgi:hypothetical protein
VNQGTNVREFSAALENYRKVELRKAVVQRQKEVAKVVWAGILLKTPVLTSLARGNWNISLGTSNASTTETPAGVGTTGMALTSAEESRLNTVLSRLEGLPLGQTVWISNGLRYVKFLESGTSDKAPAGMVSVTLNEVRTLINSRR